MELFINDVASYPQSTSSFPGPPQDNLTDAIFRPPPEIAYYSIPTFRPAHVEALLHSDAGMLGIFAQLSTAVIGAPAPAAEISPPASNLQVVESMSRGSNAISAPVNRKRKRMKMKEIKLLFESARSEIMQRQEQMHKKLMEMIEKQEEERIIREEAWKQQEMERAKRMEEFRAQDRARSLALISSIQKLLGHEIKMPTPSETFTKVEENCEFTQDDNKYPGEREWPNSEVQALIAIRLSFDNKFLVAETEGAWEEVASQMGKMGYARSPGMYRNKWDSINEFYRKRI